MNVDAPQHVSESSPRQLRIASLLAAGTEILYSLGLGDCVVAVSHECDYPPEIAHKPRVTSANILASGSSSEIDRQVKKMSREGRSLYSIDAARLASLRPDVIVTQAQCEVCAVHEGDVRAAISTRPGLGAAKVVALNPTTLESVFDDILRVGEATGACGEAKHYVEKLRARVAAVQQRHSLVTSAEPSNSSGGNSERPVPMYIGTSGRIGGMSPDVRRGTSGATAGKGQRPRVVCIEWMDPLMVAANWMPELIERAGGVCTLTNAGQRTGYTNWTEVVAFDPQVIVVSPCGFDLDRTLAEMHALAALPGWKDISAVKSQRVFAVDGNAYFNRSGPRLVDSFELLAHLIHPEASPPPSDPPDPIWQRISTGIR